MGKLTRMHVFLAGAGVAVVVGLGLFLLLINRASAELRQKIRDRDTLAQALDGVRAAPDELKKADADYQKFRRDLRRVVGAKMPSKTRLNLTRSDRDALLPQLPRWWGLPEVVVPMCERYAARNPNKVRVRTQFGVRAQTVIPEQIPSDIIVWNLGRMTVRGRFQNVLAWVERWNSFPLLAAVDDLRLRKADEDEIEATCNLIVYIFPVNQATQQALSPGGSGRL
ncbi:MAG: hypothetical protein HY320_11585 [Armatimonadetes bacterium]|nr:hypothetical protein [Armatimonadota bacterium]